MLEKSQEYLRLAIAATAILIGLSVAYHYVVYIPAKDREAKLESETTEQTKASEAREKEQAIEKAAADRRANYRVCLSTAQENYDSRWQSTCKSKSDDAARSRAQCIANGLSEEACMGYYPPTAAKDCQLPSSVSENYDSMLKEDQKRCLDEARADMGAPF
jgi:phage-related baseplate assembly protein